MKIENVSIALQPEVYKLFRNLNNTVSFTLGEFVDNAVQSYLNNKDKIQDYEFKYKLKVEITIDKDGDIITIKDNAAGIDEKNYLRAFEPAHIPTDTTGLHEFGVGMKTASVWLADKWTVKTKAFGEQVERVTTFDLDEVTKNKKEVLVVTERPKDTYSHYTIIELHQLSMNAPSSAQLDKIKRHLASIYRTFLRSEKIQIIINEEELHAPEYDILEAPFYKDPAGPSIKWKTDVSVKIGKYSAEGWVALLGTMKSAQNGIVLLRNQRVVIGGDEDKNYHPDLCGSPGSHRYKRLFGEIELKGFKVSFNKNHFQEVEIVDQLLHEIALQIRKNPENLLTQGDNYRLKTKEEMSKIANSAIISLKRQGNKENSFSEKAKYIMQSNNSPSKFSEGNRLRTQALENPIDDLRFDEMVTIDNIKYDLITEFVDNGNSALYSVMLEDKVNSILNCKVVHCRINLSHKFIASYVSLKKADDYLPIIKIFRTLAIAEITAKQKQNITAETIRDLFNLYV